MKVLLWVSLTVAEADHLFTRRRAIRDSFSVDGWHLHLLE